MVSKVEMYKEQILKLLFMPNVATTVRPESRYALIKALSHRDKGEPRREREQTVLLGPEALSAADYPTERTERSSTQDWGRMEPGHLPMVLPQRMSLQEAAELMEKKKARKLGMRQIGTQELLEKCRADCKRELQRIIKENATQYQYEQPDTQACVLYSPEVDELPLRHMKLHQLRAGTLDKLIEKVTTQKSFELRDIIITTYENYTTSYKLLLALVQRFLIPWPVNMSPGEANAMLDSRFKVVQNKILAFLRFWMTERKEDFFDPRLKMLLDAWLSYVKESKLYHHLNKIQIETQIMPLLTKLSEVAVSGKRERSGVNFDPREIVLPANIVLYESLIAGTGLLEYSPDVVAMQLALIDQKYFCSLTLGDFMTQKKTHGAKAAEAEEPTARQKLSERHNVFTNFIVAYILKEPNPLARETLIDRFLEVARRSLEFGNLNTTFMIHAALSTYGSLMKKTWPKIMAKYKKFMDDLTRLFSTDETYRQLRDYTKTLEPPCVPCFYLWGKDMDTIFQLYKDDFLPSSAADLPEEKRLINMIRQAVIADRMKDLAYYQKVRYRLYKLPTLYDFLDEDYKISLSLILDPQRNSEAFQVFLPLIQKLES